MSGLPEITDPRVLVGTNTSDDAAVYRLSDDRALVLTVDFFTPIADDPYWFGSIAAANSLSDVYAMGGKPLCALNIVGFPRANPKAPFSALGEILKGGADKAAEAGIAIVGGHTVDDAEPKYGLSVVGEVHPDKIWKNVGARPGDRLVLTKPLGSGIMTTAIRAGHPTAAAPEVLYALLATLNRSAAEAAAGVTVHACTDVTGFGLVGHLHGMVGQGGISARISVARVPLLTGLRDLVQADMVPGGSRRNLKAAKAYVDVAAGVSDDDVLILVDAQTSGGLLFAVPAQDSARLIAALAAAGTACAVDIGEIVDGQQPGRIEIVP